jgi:acetyl-CoA synthetase
VSLRLSSPLLDARTYPDALRTFAWSALWDLFDGRREGLNLAHECVDRHDGSATALRLQFADGHREEHTFGALQEWTSRFANFLEAEGIAAGDRVAIMLEPSLPFYGALFGTVKRGAVAVPLFTLFGPDGLALRLRDCTPRMLVVPPDRTDVGTLFPGLRVLPAGAALDDRLRGMPARYSASTRADDLAVLQYTSGTTRALPEAVRHTHRAVVTLMIAALYGVGLRAGDRYFCPSSPAWGHGLWHGTIAPLALGIAVGSYSGKFDPRRIVDALEAFGVTNLAAAPTVYRMLRDAGALAARRFRPAKLSFTGEPMDAKTWTFIEETFGLRPCSMYGSTEVGVILVDYPGFGEYEVRRGALGKPAPGWEVAVLDEAGQVAATGRLGDIAVRRKGEWFLVKDRGLVDADGYFFHAGRADDVIISAGWTMSAREIEDTLLQHPDVREAAVIGVPDDVRGLVPKAFVVSDRAGDAFMVEVQEFVKARLSRHEYPRLVERLEELPKTPGGKVDRRALRERRPA